MESDSAEASTPKLGIADSEKSFQRLVESVTDYAIILLDPAGRMASWNAGAERITGYRAEDVLGKHIALFYPPESIQKLEPEWALNVASADGRVACQGWRLRKDGSRFWADSVITALYDDQHRLQGFSKITRDLTKEKGETERFRQAVESAPNAMVMIDRQGKIVLVNAQTEKMFGYSRDELLGYSIEVLVPQRFRASHPRYRAGFFDDPRTRSMGAGRDLYGLCKSGMEIPVEIGLNPIQTDEGDFVLAAIVDITERKRAEEERKKSEERFRVAVESAPNPMVMVNDRGKIVLVNAQTEKLFGYGREELLGRGIEALVPHRFRERHPDFRVAFFSAPQSRPMGAGRELFGLHKDGREIPVEIGLNPIKTEEGDFVLAAIVDITERKRAEERFRLVVESSPNAIVMVNDAGQIVLVNAQTEKLFRYARSELLGLSIERLVPQRFRHGHPGHRIAFFAEPRTRAMGAGRDLFGLRKDGSEVPVEIGLNPIETPEGNFVLAAIVDITERKKADLERQELDRAKTAFFSNVSHEFRTPLTLLLGPLEDLLRAEHPALAPGDRERLEIMHRNALRLLKLVNTLLDFSRIEAGRVQAVYEPVELGGATAELASFFRSSIERAGLQFVVECPPLDQPVHVDREMWEKIVFNLLSNALKFTFEGTIAVRLERAGDNAELQVQDTGVGIPAEELPRLFERFHRVRNVRARTLEGTGIGLALVQELAKLHGGSVGVSSQVGQGSTFTVLLPLGSAHLPPARISAPRTQVSTAHGAVSYIEEFRQWVPERPSIRPPVGAQPLSFAPSPHSTSHSHAEETSATSTTEEPPLILLADDNADMREYLERLLRERWTVKVVADGSSALALARQRPPDLILADVLMPGLSGFELLRELRSDPNTRTIPIILLSARAGEEATVEGLQAGADDYLVKPFTARELVARVESNLEMSRLRRSVEREIRNANEQLEQRVDKRTAELRSLVQELETFTYTVAHDLRAPLRSMHRFCDLLLDEYAGQLDETGTDYARRIGQSASRMDLLIQDLLNYSRVARTDCDFQPIELGPLLADLLAQMAGEIEESRARVRAEEDLPSVTGDPVLISQILRNLLTNGIKFARAGVPPDVFIRGETRDGKVRIWVEDNGIGIDPKYRDKLFRLFERLHSTDRYPGTGIGLAIVRRAVERMGGEAGFEPGSEHGARFWFELTAAGAPPTGGGP